MIFLSYAHEDEARARFLSSLLEDHGAVTWSATSLPVGSSVARAIGEAVRTSDAVLVLSTPASRRSAAVGQELAAALAERLAGGPQFVVPVLVNKEDDIPPLLRDIQALDLRPPKDPETAVRSFLSLLRSNQLHPRTAQDAEIALADVQRQLIHAEALHRRTLETQVLEYNAHLQRRVQVVAAILSVLAAVTGFVLAVAGATSASLAIYIGLMISVAAASLATRRSRKGGEQ